MVAVAEEVCSMKNRFETLPPHCFAVAHPPPTSRRKARAPLIGCSGDMVAGGVKTFAPLYTTGESSRGSGGVQNFPTVRTAVQRWSVPDVTV